jgi:GTP cyclohydrolase I
LALFFSATAFLNEADIGHIAAEQIIGISKLTRLVRLFARRFTVQERLGEQIADTLVELIGPQGVAVHLEASHLCTQMRGVEEHSRTATTFWRGAYRDPDLRREFLEDVRSHKLR